jgi:hypothetical protein
MYFLQLTTALDAFTSILLFKVLPLCWVHNNVTKKYVVTDKK